jgi:hypothetical protein
MGHKHDVLGFFRSTKSLLYSKDRHDSASKVASSKWREPFLGLGFSVEGGPIRNPTFEHLGGGLDYNSIPLLASIISNSRFS